MDESGIVNICNSFGLLFSNPYAGTDRRGPHMSISCPLAAPRTQQLPSGGNHQNDFDDNLSCSVTINQDGPSLVRCHSARCGFKGSLFSLIKYASDMRNNPESMEEVVAVVKEAEAITITGILNRIGRKIKIAGAPKIVDKDVLDESTIEPFSGSVPKYAIDRGITIDTCKRWGLGHDRPRSRLVFPVRNRSGGLVGVTGRDVTGTASRKYHNYAGLNKVKYMYGSHLLEANKPIVIVEGPIDAVMADQHLYPKCCVLATLGGGFSDEHVRTIANNCPPFVVMFTDGDLAGREMSNRINYSLMDQHFIRKVIFTPEGKDPATLLKEEVNDLFDSAKMVYDRIKWK